MALDTNKCMATIVAKIEAQTTVERQVDFLKLRRKDSLMKSYRDLRLM